MEGARKSGAKRLSNEPSTTVGDEILKPQREESAADVGALPHRVADNYPPVPFFHSVHDRSIS